MRTDQQECEVESDVLTEEDVESLLYYLGENAGELALRRIIPDPEYSDRRHEFVALDADGWHSGTITETQRSCINSERYRHRSGLTGVPTDQIEIVPYEQTPFPYWTSGLVRLKCPNHDDVWRSVNEMLLPRYRGVECAVCGSDLVVSK